MTDKLVEALNRLLNIDLQSHQIYLQAAAWAGEHHLDGTKAFLLRHAAEELGHMHRTFEYLHDRDLKITFAAIPAPTFAANDVTGLLREIAAHEAKVTGVVNAAVDLARAENDHDAFQFLQWFVAEQREEEALFRTVIDKVGLLADAPGRLYFIDEELGRLAHKS